MLSVTQKMSMMIGEYMEVPKRSQHLCKTCRKKGYACNIIRSPLKNRPFAHTDVLQRYCHLKSSFRMGVRPAAEFCWISSADAKQLPFSPILSLRKTQKSHAMISGECCDNSMGGIWFFAKNCHNVRDIGVKRRHGLRGYTDADM